MVTGLRQIFATDWAPERFLDIRPFDPAHEKYGAPAWWAGTAAFASELLTVRGVTREIPLSWAIGRKIAVVGHALVRQREGWG